MGRKETLLLGWLTRGVQLAAGAAQACRDAVKRYGLAGGTRRSASARASGEAKLGRLHGPRARVGGKAGWLARPSRPRLLLLPILSFLFFYSFSILFSFLFCLLPICLGFDLFSLIIIVTIPSFWFGQEFGAYMWSPHT